MLLIPGAVYRRLLRLILGGAYMLLLKAATYYRGVRSTLVRPETLLVRDPSRFGGVSATNCPTRRTIGKRPLNLEVSYE